MSKADLQREAALLDINIYNDAPGTIRHLKSDEQLTDELRVVSRAVELRGLWQASLAEHHQHDTEETALAEQAAHDRLVDYVEAQGLNYTKWDPRGLT